MKLVFLVDHALQNSGQFPSERDLRERFRHDLERLFAYAETVHERMPNKEGRFQVPRGSIEEDILKFMSSFAKTTRYYNLNYLVGGNAAGTSVDPVADWFNRIGSKILARHYSERQKSKDLRSAELMEAALGGYALIRHTAEDGAALTSVQSAALQTGKNKVMQKYGTFYCVKLVRFLYMILSDLIYESYSARLDIPHLDEFFFPFLNKDAYLLSRKTFPPQSQ